MTKESLCEQRVIRADRDLLPLPDRAGAVIRNGVFKLVNDTLQEAFPGQFGSIIPPLRPNDVHVVKEKDYLTFMRKHLKEGTHSYLRKQLSEVLNDFHSSTFDNLLT